MRVRNCLSRTLRPVPASLGEEIQPRELQLGPNTSMLITESCFYRCCLVNFATLNKSFSVGQSYRLRMLPKVMKSWSTSGRKTYRKWMERLGISVSEEELH